MNSDRQAAMDMEQEGGAHGEYAPAMSAKKLWRVLRAVHLVLVKGLGKHQPKLAALGVHLHHLLSRRRQHRLAGAAREHPALSTYLSALSCRSMDPAAAVHPYPRGRGASGGASLSSTLSCRSMDPAAAVYQHQYRPREVEFSCSSPPLHRRRRRRAQRRGLHLQQHGHGHEHDLPEHSSAARVTRLFEMLDVAEAMDGDDDDGHLAESARPWAAAPAPRQVRITDSPFPAREEDEDEAGTGVVDRRADEFIMWFHDQLRMQQQQQRPAARERRPTYWVR